MQRWARDGIVLRNGHIFFKRAPKRTLNPLTPLEELYSCVQPAIPNVFPIEIENDYAVVTSRMIQVILFPRDRFDDSVLRN